MTKRTVFTTITPLPADISRETATDFLHSHIDMIDLNPLVTERHPIRPPPHAGIDEQHCVWYSLTDKVDVLGKSNSVNYTCAFNDLSNGLQTHCYAPMGLDIRDRWTVGGSMPGEPVEPVELGINAPSTGLYIREDVEMRCNIFMTGFVKKTLKKSHAELVERLKLRAREVSSTAETDEPQWWRLKVDIPSIDDKPLPSLPPNATPSPPPSRGGLGPSFHRRINSNSNSSSGFQAPLYTHGLSMAEQWMLQQQGQQLTSQGSMFAPPTIYRVPTIRQSNQHSHHQRPSSSQHQRQHFRAPSASSRGLHRTHGSLSSLASLSATVSARSSQGPPTPPQQQEAICPPPEAGHWAGAKTYGAEVERLSDESSGVSTTFRAPLRRVEAVVLSGQQHPVVPQPSRGAQGFIAELE